MAASGPDSLHFRDGRAQIYRYVLSNNSQLWTVKQTFTKLISILTAEEETEGSNTVQTNSNQKKKLSYKLFYNVIKSKGYCMQSNITHLSHLFLNTFKNKQGLTKLLYKSERKK